MKNNLLPISIVALALSIVLTGYLYLDSYKVKNNFNTIRVDTVEVSDNIQPKILLATFDVSFGVYDYSKGPTFEQTNGIKILVQDLKNRLEKENCKDCLVSWRGAYQYGTTTEYLSGVKMEVPLSNNLNEESLSKILKDYYPRGLIITRNINDKDYESLSLETENRNLKKNRKQAEEKADILKTRVIDVANNLNQDSYEYKPMNNIIEENTDGTIKLTNFATVNYIIAK